jgi:hypothetical protein
MMNYRWKHTGVVAATLALSLVAAPLALAEDPAEPTARLKKTVDFIGAANLPGHDGIAVAGRYGMVGLLKREGDILKLHRLANPPKEDFTAVARLSDTVALIGSSIGNIYSYDGTTLTKLVKLTEYLEPVLSITTHKGRAWAVGGRGMVARSPDGKTWEEVKVRDVVQPRITWTAGTATSWYFGMSNIDTDTINFTANVGGEPATDEQFEIFSEEGYLQNSVDFDMDPAPRIDFKFNPGPPFRPGDVTWNLVLIDDDTVLIAGEFGLILQSKDNGDTWVRRDTRMVDHEPDFPYWLTGVQDGKDIHLAGAAGVSSVSRDGGLSWQVQPRPGNEGIFGITLLDSGEPLIAGAVGLIGKFDGSTWTLADRTRLNLISWLKNPVPLDDGSVLMLGGRSTAISFKHGTWTRVNVDVD